jgi:hypothetical protein
VGNALFNSDSPGIDRGLAAGGQALGTVAGALNPVSGLYATASGLGSAINDSPTPGRAIGRLMLTGERGALPDILATVHSADLQPSQSPVRQNGWQLPNIPQLQAIFPAGVPQNGGPGLDGIQRSAGVIPGPGGGAYSQRPAPTEDQDPIPFIANPQPYQAASYSVDQVKQAVVSLASPNPILPPGIQNLFAPDEIQFMKTLAGVPMPQAVEMFRGYMKDKLVPQGNSVLPDSGYSGRPNPGGGAMF